MKILNLEARYTKKIEVPDRFIQNLPEKVCLFMSVQFLDSLDEIKKSIEKSEIKTGQDKKTKRKAVLKETRHTRYLGQLYGCNNQHIKGDFDAFFYVGDGEFHPKALALANDKPIYTYNPIENKFKEWKNDYFLKEKKKTMAAYSSFLHSTHIGVIATTKFGQNKIRLGRIIEKRFPEKTFHYMIFNTLEFDRLEDFPFIECFVSTACERIAFEDRKKFPRPVINAEDILYPDRLAE